MRGLAPYGSPEARAAARRAAEVFLAWREFVKLHQPLYWHCDVLGGLAGMARAAARLAVLTMLALAAAVPPGHGVNRTSVRAVELKDSIVDDQVGVTRG